MTNDVKTYLFWNFEPQDPYPIFLFSNINIKITIHFLIFLYRLFTKQSCQTLTPVVFK